MQTSSQYYYHLEPNIHDLRSGSRGFPVLYIISKKKKKDSIQNIEWQNTAVRELQKKKKKKNDTSYWSAIFVIL